MARLIDADALKNDGQLYIHGADGKDYYEVDHAPTVDAVHRETLAQVMWERDVAMKQLEKHGIPFGCKADVRAVKHGKWELHLDGSGTCNRCNFTSKNVWDFDSWQNYCGHCGAKMDEE